MVPMNMARMNFENIWLKSLDITSNVTAFVPCKPTSRTNSTDDLDPYVTHMDQKHTFQSDSTECSLQDNKIVYIWSQ